MARRRRCGRCIPDTSGRCRVGGIRGPGMHTPCSHSRHAAAPSRRQRSFVRMSPHRACRSGSSLRESSYRYTAPTAAGKTLTIRTPRAGRRVWSPCWGGSWTCPPPNSSPERRSPTRLCRCGCSSNCRASPNRLRRAPEKVGSMGSPSAGCSTAAMSRRSPCNWSRSGMWFARGAGRHTACSGIRRCRPVRLCRSGCSCRGSRPLDTSCPEPARTMSMRSLSGSCSLCTPIRASGKQRPHTHRVCPPRHHGAW